MSEADARRSLQHALMQEPTQSKLLVTLSQLVQWKANYHQHLGPFKAFIDNHCSDLIELTANPGINTGHIAQLRQRSPKQQNNFISIGTLGKYVQNQGVHKKSSEKSIPAGDLWRPFDKDDDFFKDRNRMRNINDHKDHMWKQIFHPDRNESPLGTLDVSYAKDVFDQAYNKSARLTVSLRNVINSDNLLSELRALLHDRVDLDEGMALFAQTAVSANSGKMYNNASSTAWGPGHMGSTAASTLTKLVRLLDAGKIDYRGNTIGVHLIGFGPIWLSVTRSVQEILYKKSDHTSRAPVRMDSGNVDATRHSLLTSFPSVLPSAPYWPDEIHYTALYDPVISPNHPFLVARRSLQSNREIALRKRCGEERSKSAGERYMYDDQSGVEWIGEDFELGAGVEATVHMGLMRDPSIDANSVGEQFRTLVAVKQSTVNKTNPFNSQEIQHFLTLDKQPGIVRYHRGREVRHASTKFSVLVQDIGLSCLRKLISGDHANNIKPAELTVPEKFKLTKALCMAVCKLHSMDPSIVHRDIRPENVLIMDDGTIALTDFGLARKALHKGSSLHTTNVLTTMQPYEVQKCFMAEEAGVYDPKAKLKIPVTHAGDVFMLGLTIAYINLGRNVFKDDRDIMDGKAPDLGCMKDTEPWLYHLISNMTALNKDVRPSMKSVLEHPYFVYNCHKDYNNGLIANLENYIVMGGHPIDNGSFHMLEELLAPIEKEIANLPLTSRWHSSLPPSLFNGNSKLPSQNIVFTSLGGAAVRAYPLPNVAQLVRWLRNLATHYHESVEQQNVIRRTRGELAGDASLYYPTVGDFFTKHPAVSMLLPNIWLRAMEMNRACFEKKRTMLLELERVQQAVETGVYETDARISFLAELSKQT